MRCFCCNEELTDYEATLKSSTTNQYLDMCGFCIKESGISTYSQSTLLQAQDYEEENDNF